MKTLTLEKQALQQAMKIKNSSISLLKSVLHGSITSVQTIMETLGMSQFEEVKEESEDKLVRLLDQVEVAVQDGSIVYS